MLPGPKVASMILRVAFVLALLFGLGFWTTLITAQQPLVLVHMLLGLTVVGALWYLGLAQAQRGGSLGLTLGTFALGLVVAIFGLLQTSLRAPLGNVTVDVIHLVLGVLAIGLGEMCMGRITRASAKAG